MCKLSVQAAAQHVQRPQVWFKSLVAAQQHIDVLKLDSSARAKLGVAVEKMIRVMLLVEDFNGARKLTPFCEDQWTSKAAVREGIAALNDMANVQLPGADESLPGVSEAYGHLRQVASGTVMGAVLKLREAKKKMLPVFEDMTKIMEGVEQMQLEDDNFPEPLKASVGKYNQPGELQQAMKDCTQGKAWFSVHPR